MRGPAEQCFALTGPAAVEGVWAASAGSSNPEVAVTTVISAARPAIRVSLIVALLPCYPACPSVVIELGLWPPG